MRLPLSPAYCIHIQLPTCINLQHLTLFLLCFYLGLLSITWILYDLFTFFYFGLPYFLSIFLYIPARCCLISVLDLTSSPFYLLHYINVKSTNTSNITPSIPRFRISSRTTITRRPRSLHRRHRTHHSTGFIPPPPRTTRTIRQLRFRDGTGIFP